MRRGSLLLLACLALAGCAEDTKHVVMGTVTREPFQWQWLIHGDDGQLYQPYQLDESLVVDGLRIRAVVAPETFGVLWSMGQHVRVVEAAPERCAVAACTVPKVAWLYVQGLSAEGPLQAATASNVVGPAGEPAAAASCAVVAGSIEKDARYVTCDLVGPGPGTYQLDVSAPGFHDEHVTVEVAPSPSAEVGCCSAGALPTVVWVWPTAVNP